MWKDLEELYQMFRTLQIRSVAATVPKRNNHRYQEEDSSSPVTETTTTKKNAGPESFF